MQKMWDLPESLVDVIRHHHKPEDSESHSDLNHLVYLADLLMSRFIVGQDLERQSTDSFHERP